MGRKFDNIKWTEFNFVKMFELLLVILKLLSKSVFDILIKTALFKTVANFGTFVNLFPRRPRKRANKFKYFVGY